MTSPEGDQDDPGGTLPDKIEFFRKEGMDFQVICINQDQGTHLNLTKMEFVNRPSAHTLHWASKGIKPQGFGGGGGLQGCDPGTRRCQRIFWLKIVF